MSAWHFLPMCFQYRLKTFFGTLLGVESSDTGQVAVIGELFDSEQIFTGLGQPFVRSGIHSSSCPPSLSSRLNELLISINFCHSFLL